MIKRTKCIYLAISAILTLIFQIMCFKYILDDKLLLLISTLLYVTCFFAIVESIHLIFKKKDIKQNLELLFIGICGVSLMLLVIIYR